MDIASLYVESLRGVHAQLKPLQTSVKVSTEHALHTGCLYRGSPYPVPTVTLLGTSLIKCAFRCAYQVSFADHTSLSRIIPCTLKGYSTFKQVYLK